MNILPKKSWHVRNKDNVARVRRDEAQAAAEENERQRRIALAESEARTDQLRKLTVKRHSDHADRQVVQTVTVEHINFFKDAEENLKKHQASLEKDADKKAEQEKFEKSIGLLTYLGQSVLESKDTKQWYEKPREEKKEALHKKTREEFDHKRKLSLDPMRMMNEQITKKTKYEEQKRPQDKQLKVSEYQKKKLESSGPKTIEQLRAERLLREKTERKRAQELIMRQRGEQSTGHVVEEIIDERRRPYNSQYNPEFVRRPKNNHYS